MKAFVSSYAAVPSSGPWNRDLEAAVFDGLARMGLAGLELPYYGRLHAHDDAWLIDRLRPEWRFVLTLLPGTMSRAAENPRFGLASADADGRKRALEFAEQARRTVEHLHSYLGYPAVVAVSVHSAPRLAGGPAKSSLEAFAGSLSDLRRRDWRGAELLVEHCDAAGTGQAPDKGFLRLEDEVAALKLSAGATPARVLINWGRSALETRSPEGPREHIRRAREADLLAGLFFSGVTPEHPEWGAWKDSHAPLSTVCPASLLTPEAVKESLRDAGDVSCLGVKVQPLPASLDAPARLAMIRDMLDLL